MPTSARPRVETRTSTPKCTPARAAQAGGAGLVKRGVMPTDALFFFASLDKVKFRNQVRPGDEVRIVVKNLRVSTHMIKQSGIAYVGDKIAAEAEWMCLVGSK